MYEKFTFKIISPIRIPQVSAGLSEFGLEKNKHNLKPKYFTIKMVTFSHFGY
jgi:hypothetical protein